VARLLGVRSTDVAVMRWLVALFAVTQAGHGLGANTGDALLFVRYGVESLPPMIALSGVAIMVVTVAYAATMSRVGLPRLLPPVAWGLAGALLVERAAVAVDRPVIYAVIWLTEQVVVLLTFTMMWGAAGEACDTRQAKRLFPLLASAGIAGGFLGNLLTGPLAARIGTANVLLVHAALLIAVGLLLRAVARRFFAAARTSSSGALDELRAGLRATRSSRLFRLTSVVAFALSVLFFLVVVPFAEVVTDSFGSDAEVAGFLGYFSALATAASLLVSLLVTNRLLRVLGVVGTVLVVPVLYGIGFTMWAVSFTLVTAALVRGVQWVAVNAIGGTAWQGLFNVVRPPVRGQVMAFVTAVPTQLGVTASGVALTLGIADLPLRWLSLIGTVAAVTTTVVVLRMRPAYVTDLLAALRRGIGDVFDVTARSPAPPVPGRDARLALRAAVADDHAPRRRRAVQLVGILDDPPVELLLEAVTDDDPQVRATAVALLDRVDDARAAAAAANAFADDDARVRRAAVRAVGRGPHGDGIVSAALQDPDPLVRAAAAAADRGAAGRQVVAGLLRSPAEQHVVAALDVAAAWPDATALPDIAALTTDTRPAVRLRAATAVAARGGTPLATLLPLLGDDDPRVREGVADLLRGHGACTAELLTMLRDAPIVAQAAAVRALRGEPAAHDELVRWAIARAERAEAIRTYRAELPSIITTRSSSRDYLDRVLEQRGWQALRGVLLALESLAGGTATQLLTRGIRAGDPQVRAQAVEAIDSLGDRTLTRHVLPLLEDDAAPVASTGTVTTWSVLDDPDVWLRALAVRAAVDHIDALRSLVSGHARRDGAALVIDALSSGEEVAVTQHDRTRGIIDTILALQQVPMFSDLPPEDLQHVAEHCDDRVYGPDETIYHQGDIGEEMFILTSGRVRISRDDDGARTVVRTYGPGDHVGELSLLRGRPRVADVIADSDGAEGLALDAEAFRAIIEGRPEVAIAMLATLAERIGTA
jgi:HEAT repeat protein